MLLAAVLSRVSPCRLSSVRMILTLHPTFVQIRSGPFCYCTPASLVSLGPAIETFKLFSLATTHLLWHCRQANRSPSCCGCQGEVDVIYVNQARNLCSISIERFIESSGLDHGDAVACWILCETRSYDVAGVATTDYLNRE